MSILIHFFTQVRAAERKLENKLISLERTIENRLISWLTPSLNLAGSEKDWVPKNLQEPYRTYYFMTRPNPMDINPWPQFQNKHRLKINLGAGPEFKHHAPDWVTIDFCEHGDERGTDVNIDFGREPLPFPDRSVALAYSSHTVEHMPKDKLVFLINELSRVMEPRGIVRIICPDLEAAVMAYYHQDKEFFWRRWNQEKWRKWNHPISLRGGLDTISVSECLSHEVACLNNSGQLSHVNALDYEYLSLLFRDSGFKYTARSKSQQSSIPELCAPHFDRLRRNYHHFSLYFEASLELDVTRLQPKRLQSLRQTEPCHEWRPS